MKKYYYVFSYTDYLPPAVDDYEFFSTHEEALARYVEKATGAKDKSLIYTDTYLELGECDSASINATKKVLLSKHLKK